MYLNKPIQVVNIQRYLDLKRRKLAKNPAKPDLPNVPPTPNNEGGNHCTTIAMRLGAVNSFLVGHRQVNEVNLSTDCCQVLSADINSLINKAESHVYICSDTIHHLSLFHISGDMWVPNWRVMCFTIEKWLVEYLNLSHCNVKLRYRYLFSRFSAWHKPSNHWLEKHTVGCCPRSFRHCRWPGWRRCTTAHYTDQEYVRQTKEHIRTNGKNRYNLWKNGIKRTLWYLFLHTVRN